jgi:hypothetical protein
MSRRVLFTCGLVVGALSAVLVFGCWLDPFPLVVTKGGGYSDLWESVLLVSASGTAFLTIILALFGQHLPRILLLLSGFLLLIFSFGALIANDT